MVGLKGLCLLCEINVFFEFIDFFNFGYEDIVDILFCVLMLKLQCFCEKKVWNYECYFVFYVLEYFCFFFMYFMNVYVYFFFICDSKSEYRLNCYC